MSTEPILATAIRGALVSSFPEMAQFPAEKLVRVIDSVISRAAFAGTDMHINDREAGKEIPPKQEHVAAFFKQLGSKVDPDDFINFYEARDWTVDARGKIKMKNWRAAARRWHKNGWGTPPAGGGKKAFFA